MSSKQHPDFLNDKSFQFINQSNLSDECCRTFLQTEHSNVTRWKEETRGRILQSLCYAPPRVPFNAKVVETVEFEHYIRETITFDSAPGCTIPAYLCIPKNLTKPAPAMVALHDHGGRYYWGKEKNVEHVDIHPFLKEHIDEYYDGVPVAAGLANQGYVVLSIDSLYFGERRYKLEDDNNPFKDSFENTIPGSTEYIRKYHQIARVNEANMAKSVLLKGYTFMGIRTWDDIASVDYLCSRPEVDSSRIGCIGLSMGGHRAGWLGALDDRVKCTIIIGWMARYEDMIRLRINNVSIMWSAPGFHNQLDYPDVVSLAVPKPLLVLHGKRDALFPEETGEKAIEQIRAVYRKAGNEPMYTATVYDAPHVYNRAMQEQANNWLKVHL